MSWQLRKLKSQDDFYEVWLPPVSEQKKLIEVVMKKELELNALQTELKTQSNLLSKLRQAYLQEAVMGKLSEPRLSGLKDDKILDEKILSSFNPSGATFRNHSPDKETGKALLAQIKAQKAELIKQGKLRKEKPLPPIKPEEIPFKIPDNWVWCRLGEICEIGTGATPLTSNPEYYQNGNIAWVTSSLTGNLFVREPTSFITDKALKETNCKVYPKGTLLMAMYGQGKTRGQITELLIDAAINQACVAIEFTSKFEYLKGYLKIYFQKIYLEIRELASGGAQPNLNMQKIKTTIIPLPPFSEQKAIVEKVGGLLATVSLLEEENKIQQKEVQRLMGAVLQEAFGGSI